MDIEHPPANFKYDVDLRQKKSATGVAAVPTPVIDPASVNSFWAGVYPGFGCYGDSNVSPAMISTSRVHIHCGTLPDCFVINQTP